MMQKKKRQIFRTDLRAPLVICAVIGLVMLLLLTAATLLVEEDLFFYGLALCGVKYSFNGTSV